MPFSSRSLRVLLACLPLLLAPPYSPAQPPSYALKGTIVTPTEVLSGGTILISGNTIQAVGKSVAIPAGTPIIDTGGILYPGLIDLHNHVTWNVFPRWHPSRLYPNRYEWQTVAGSQLVLDVPHESLIAEGHGCAMERYAEVKAIAAGATSQAGLHPTDITTAKGCLAGLVRELGIDSRLHPTSGPATPNSENLRYEVFPLTLDETQAASIRDGLKNGAVTAALLHLGEGNPNDAASQMEYRILRARGLLLPGVSLIHGVALHPPQFEEMAKIGVGLIWSPRSNFELYGATAGLAAAKQAGVKIALAPDWSPTGSDGMIQELKYASVWNETQSPKPFTPAELFRMATSTAAELAGISTSTGSIAPGKRADLLVIKSTEPDAYKALLHVGPADIALVTIDGAALYGDAPLLNQLRPGQPLSPVTVCGGQKQVALPAFGEITAELTTALAHWGSGLGPIAPCP